MHFRVLAATATTRTFATRLPFRFGAVTITELQRVLLHLRVVGPDGREADGFAADFMVPRWFDKRAEGTPADDVRALEESLRIAVQRLLRPNGNTVFAQWLALERATFEGLRDDPDAALVAGFGLALVERALMDAACRWAGISFHAALVRNLFAFDAGQVIAELGSWRVELNLPNNPARTVRLRHTVGYLDALRRTDAAAVAMPTDERASNAPALHAEHLANDGLPATLEDAIDHYGLTAFKVKLSGDTTRDLPRLLAVANLLVDSVPRATLRVTLDANEQYADLDALGLVLDRLTEDPAGRRFLCALAFVEQPLPRRLCCAPETAAAIQRFARHAPLLLDEGDSDTLAFARARSHGWSGVSVKPCKGVFRALLNRGLVERSNGKLFLSAEDLTCPPTTALQQDLALVASLELPDVEKNAHHYFRGLDALGDEERSGALRTHPHLYERSGAMVHLAVRKGLLNLSDMDSVGFGAGADPRNSADAILLRMEAP